MESSTRPRLRRSITYPKSTALPKSVKPWHPFRGVLFQTHISHQTTRAVGEFRDFAHRGIDGRTNLRATFESRYAYEPKVIGLDFVADSREAAQVYSLGFQPQVDHRQTRFKLRRSAGATSRHHGKSIQDSIKKTFVCVHPIRGIRRSAAEILRPYQG